MNKAERDLHSVILYLYTEQKQKSETKISLEALFNIISACKPLGLDWVFLVLHRCYYYCVMLMLITRRRKALL